MKRFWRGIRRAARRFGLARVLCLLVLANFVMWRIADPIPVEELRLRTFDFFQILDPRKKTARPVRIVDIDEKSLEKLGQWPWSRSTLAELVTRLTQMGAVVIAFDVLFPEPDRLNPGAVADTMPGLDASTRAKLRELPPNDKVFASAIARSRVVLGESGLPRRVEQLDTSLPVTGLAMLGGEPQPYLVEFPGLLRNLPLLEQAAAGRGILTIRTERDGIVRRVPILMQVQDITMPSLSVEMLRVATGTDTFFVRTDRAGVKSVGLKGLEIQTDRNGQLWVHFARHDPSIFVSASDVMNGQVDPDVIRGRLVLIGTSAVGLLDAKTTPIDPVMPGVEIHAQVLESVLTKTVLTEPNWALGVEHIATVILGLFIVGVAPFFSAVWLFLFGLMTFASLLGTSWYFYAHERLLIDATYPVMSSSTIVLMLVFSGFFRERSQRRRIRSAFGQYISPALVEQLAQTRDKLVLGGQEKVMTFLFSDVRGFTTIAESFKRDPQGLISLLNRFLTPLTNAIINRRGTIDKYMGDAIVAFWNAPLDDADHALHAVEAALDMIDKTDELNLVREAEAAEQNRPFIPLKIGIGLNTGPCVVGNMGSTLRFDYSVMGDSVNLASRLEGQSKAYGLPIIVGSATAMAVKERFAILEIDFIMVKGKTEPEVVYAILGRESVANSEQFQRLRNLFIEMLAQYRSRQWDDALAAIHSVELGDDRHQLQALLDIYMQRIADFKLKPPPDDWDGAFALLTK
jgi:adenylate cyclase